MNPKSVKRISKQVLSGLVAVLFAGCMTVEETGRNQIIITSPEQEMEMGLTAFTEMKSEMPISTNAEYNAQVKRVGERIAAVADLPNAQWEFVVFESEQANAFCLPGGKIGVYTGILPITQTDDGLATVLGHEVAHATKRHGGERVTEAYGVSLLGAGLSAALNDQNPELQAGVMAAFGVSAQVGLALPHSRIQESEADYVGLLYMARAGYDPEESVQFWTRFAEYNQQHGGAEGAWFLRTHPLTQTRINELNSHLPEAKQIYEASQAR